MNCQIPNAIETIFGKIIVNDANHPSLIEACSDSSDSFGFLSKT